MLTLALAYGAALLASWVHLAETFALLERPGRYWVGALAATAVDLGLAALALALAERARRGQPTRSLRGAVVLFAVVSALANWDHALSVLQARPATWADVGGLDGLAMARAVVFSATLPLLVVTLAYVVDRLAADRARDHVLTPPNGARPPGGRSSRRAAGGGAAQRAALLEAARDHPSASITDLARTIARPRQTVSRWARELGAAGALTRGPEGWRVNGAEPGAEPGDRGGMV
jgi:hypothetical protein